MIGQRDSLDLPEGSDSFMNQKHRIAFLDDDGDGLVTSEKSREYCNAGDLTGSPRSNGKSAVYMPAGVEKIEASVVSVEYMEATAVASGHPGADRVEGLSVDHQEAGAQENCTGQNASFLEGKSLESMPVVPANSGEKKVGTLLAAAMRKYAAPRSSCYHGVTKLKWSGKYEAHLWDNTSKVEGRKRKGKHVYLGSYDSEEKAARAHDLAVLKYWGPGQTSKLNFPVSEYEKELEIMETMTQEEYIVHVRRQSSCFSRGASAYRGVQEGKMGNGRLESVGLVRAGMSKTYILELMKQRKKLQRHTTLLQLSFEEFMQRPILILATTARVLSSKVKGPSIQQVRDLNLFYVCKYSYFHSS